MRCGSSARSICPRCRGSDRDGEIEGVAARKRGTARAGARSTRRKQAEPKRFLPSGRSIALGLALLGLAGGAYAAALETSVFAVRTLKISGGSPQTQAEVRAVLTPELGRSLLRVSASDVDSRVAEVPNVLSVRIDRGFPHTLRVIIRPEHPVLLLRQGSNGWVVSARGRVLRQVKNPRVSVLPRVWVAKHAAITIGTTLAPDEGGTAAAALAPLVGSRMFAHVKFVREADKELTLVFRSGVELGSATRATSASSTRSRAGSSA